MRRLSFVIALVGFAACGSSDEHRVGVASDEPVRTRAQVVEIAKTCASRVADSFERRPDTGEALDVRALVCPAVYADGTCAGAWIDAFQNQREGLPGVAKACTSYCPKLPEPRPALCAGPVETRGLADAIRELDRAIVAYETGDDQIAMVFSRTKIDMMRMRDTVVAPRAPAPGPVVPDVVVQVEQDGLRYDGDPISRADLEAKLQGIDRAATVAVQATEGVPTERVAELMEAIKAMGFARVAFVPQPR